MIRRLDHSSDDKLSSFGWLIAACHFDFNHWLRRLLSISEQEEDSIEETKNLFKIENLQFCRSEPDY